MAVETVDVVVSVDVIVGPDDDDAMTLVGGLLGAKGELRVAGFGFDARVSRVAKPGQI